MELELVVEILDEAIAEQIVGNLALTERELLVSKLHQLTRSHPDVPKEIWALHLDSWVLTDDYKDEYLLPDDPAISEFFRDYWDTIESYQ